MKPLKNARIQKDDEGCYWLHVESSAGMASVNLSAQGSPLISRVLEVWAREQMEEPPSSEPKLKLVKPTDSSKT